MLTRPTESRHRSGAPALHAVAAPRPQPARVSRRHPEETRALPRPSHQPLGSYPPPRRVSPAFAEPREPPPAAAYAGRPTAPLKRSPRRHSHEAALFQPPRSPAAARHFLREQHSARAAVEPCPPAWPVFASRAPAEPRRRPLGSHSPPNLWSQPALRPYQAWPRRPPSAPAPAPGQGSWPCLPRVARSAKGAGPGIPLTTKTTIEIRAHRTWRPSCSARLPAGTLRATSETIPPRWAAAPIHRRHHPPPRHRGVQVAHTHGAIRVERWVTPSLR